MEQTVREIDREADKIVREIGIPPCPAILTKLLKEMREDEPDYNKASKLISTDVGLSAAMLKTVNSPFFGLRTKATSVNQALQLMGLRNTVEIVTGLLLRQVFPVGDNAAMDGFWQASSGIAEVTAQLARPLGITNRDEAYTFALFRDCGIPLMIGQFSGYANFMKVSHLDSGRAITADEIDEFGVDHASLGARLAQSWLLPEETCLAIQNHHDYPLLQGGSVADGICTLVALVLAAEWIYTRHNIGPKCREWSQGGGFALDVLGISEEELMAKAEKIDH
ncbi:MAG: HDOD domain-containing protein [Betaproteobacteria bacterium]|nr:HDOD domain-containing protein [Betaproteobacteria bacterium]